MVIAFGRSAAVVTGFEFDRTTVIEAIDAISPTHETADLDAARRLAAAYAGDAEEDGAQPADVVLFSDGVIAPPRDAVGYRRRRGRFRYVHIGPATPADSSATGDAPAGADNLGIVAFSARRDYEDPARLLVFARLLNASTRHRT